VVELDRAACGDRGSKCRRNPCDRVPVYVGYTWHSIGKRLEQHRSGTDPGGKKWVQRHGLDLRPELVDPRCEIRDRTEAERAEKALARRLRKKGFCVYGGH